MTWLSFAAVVGDKLKAIIIGDSIQILFIKVKNEHLL